MIYQLLNIGRIADQGGYHRCWMEPGVPLLVAPGCLLQLMIDSQDGEPVPALRLETIDGRQFESPVPAGCQLDARPLAKVFVVPRALEIDAGRPRRLLVELIRLDAGAHTHQEVTKP